MIDRYDPEAPPAPEEWLGLDEAERQVLVADFHRDARIPLPKSARNVHAALHVIVENQLAMNDPEVVRAALKRLLGEGLTRHDAIHAIGSVLAEHLRHALQQPESAPSAPDHTAYLAALERLTARSWRGA